MSRYFTEISKFKYSPHAAIDDVFCYRYYNSSELINGKTMEEWLRFSVCFWHTFRGQGVDPFGKPTLKRPWDGPDTIETCKKRLDAAFELMQILGNKFWTFHDRDIAWEGETIDETNRILDEVTDYALELMKRDGVKVLWMTCNMFAHPRYREGAATSPHLPTYAQAGAQLRKGLEVARKLGAENFVFWGGREGYNYLANTNLSLELRNYAAMLRMAVAYKKEIGFTGQFLIEPKPREPTTHQYDYDAMSSIGFLKTFDLAEHFKLNIEPNHTMLAGHAFVHDIAMADAFGMLGSIDANTGTAELGWDTDQFISDPAQALQLGLAVMRAAGGRGLAPGGLNFDCKVRRESTEPLDIVLAHAGTMDTLARGLRMAARALEDGWLARHLQERYVTFDSDFGHGIQQGNITLHDLEDYAKSDTSKEMTSSHQEKLETILSRYVV